MKRHWKTGLILLGVLSLVVLGVPEIGMIAAITVIGLPVAIAYWAIPAVFMISMLVFFIMRAGGLNGKAGLVAAALASGLVLAVPPFFLNKMIESDAQTFIAGDRDRLEIPSRVNAIGVLQRDMHRNRNNPRTTCDGFCLHALLTGSASRVLISKDTPRNLVFSAAQPALEYRLERRSQCSDVEFGPGMHELKLQSTNGSKERSVSAVEVMKLEISRGNCLVTSETTLGEADWVVLRGRIKNPEYRKRSDSFSLFKSTAQADRLAVYRKQGSGDFDEVYRWTGVQYEPFLPVLLPGPIQLHGLNMTMGWMRREAKLNIEDKYYERPDWEGFLTGTLGFDLKLKPGRVQEELPKTIEQILSEARPPTRQEWAFVKEYFDRLGIAANARMQQADFELALKLLAKPEFPTLPRLYNVNRYLEKNGTPAQESEFARHLMDRLERGRTWSENLGQDVNEDLRTIDGGFQRLSEEALQPHRERHLAIARDADVQIHAYGVVSKTEIFGEPAVPVLLASMEAGLKGGETFFRNNEYQHPYLGGLKGLCNGGERVKSALPTLLAWSKEGKLPQHASYGELLAKTLIRLGADENTVWSIYKTDDKNRTKDRFDRLVRKATGKRVQCYY